MTVIMSVCGAGMCRYRGDEGGNDTMSLQVEKLEKNMAKLTIEVSAEEFDKAVEKVYQKEKSRINIPGFRKGKAPRNADSGR